MIVRLKQAENNNIFIFLRPLTLKLWLVIFVFLISAGITIFILESKTRAPLRISISRHVGTILQLLLFAYRKFFYQKIVSQYHKMLSVIKENLRTQSAISN